MTERKEQCSSCREPTVSRTTFGRPLCPRCKARPLKTPALASLAKRGGSKPKVAQCRICLAEESGEVAENQFVSSLKNGICKDRAACEERCPPLFRAEDL